MFIHVESKYLHGQLVTSENWAFLTRFCFLTQNGKFQFDFVISSPPDVNPKVNLLLYYDSPKQWPSVYPSNKTCEEKISVLSPEHGQIVPLRASSDWTKVSGCTFIDNPWTKLHCSSHRMFQSAKPRWWFIALADCSSQIGLNITYYISLTNGSPGSFWREHFSADEFGLLPISIFAVIAYIILLSISIYVALQLRSRRLLHVTYKIFMGSMICQLTGICSEMYSLIQRGLTGYNAPSITLLGNLFEVFGENLYTLLMLLLALGYTVTKSVLSHRQMWCVFWFITMSIFMQVSLFIYQAEVFDPGLVLYIYESPPGYLLILTKIIAWSVFCSCCFRTSKKSTTKFHFYASLLTLGSAWFLCHPLTVLAITFAVDKWIRESVVKGCSLWIVFVGHALFLYVTRPASSNERFPFHIRTCQVVPIAIGQDHYYEPRRTNTASVFTIHFRNQQTAVPG
ncbi:transmembrane protein 145-like [Chelonus insularis]|uniref:transmembrane protein 145-like n=1 Tax=Chelonus insularis TaxID=460826 RepID=UPI00158DED93|nr:transmembrane protein 145-like [Chelonus insularis]